MPIRITQNQLAAQFHNDIAGVYEKMARTQRELSSGVRINRPSDDPFGTSQVLGFDAQLGDIAQYRRNVGDALGILDTEDSALGAVGDALQRIRELMVKAANGVNDQGALDAIAAEVGQLKESVRDSVNARHGSQHVFSATATDQPPYPAPANIYAGTAVQMTRRVSPGLTVQVAVDGTQVLGPNGANTLDLIDQVVADLTAGNRPAFGGHLASLDTALDRVLNVRSQLGSVTARLEVTQEQLGAMEERLLTARSEVADVDFTKAYTEFQNQQTMYQSALAAGTRILQTSILDWI